MIKNIITSLLACGILFFSQCNSQVPVELTVNEKEKKVDVMIDGRLFTSYIYPENIKKPVLWPLLSEDGNMLTRGYPLQMKAGDRTDHPHQIGIWLTYGDVNGLDFWNNSEAIPEDERNNYGTIYHQSIEKTESGRGKGVLKTTAKWEGPDGKLLLNENSSFEFIAKENVRIIDRKTTLRAMNNEVKFTDNKEGLFGMRVARELEFPDNKPTKLVDSHGIITEVEAMDNSLVKGNYRSADGTEGLGVWGTSCRWMKLSSEINGEQVALVIIDHPSNVGYPTYWHARGYGLFAANNLGQKIFSNGDKELNFSLNKGEEVTFKYRLVVVHGDITDEEINTLADEFAKK